MLPTSQSAGDADESESASLLTRSTHRTILVSFGPLSKRNVGLTLRDEGDAVTVAAVEDGSAASAQGVRVGAKIVEVAGISTKGKDHDAVIGLIKGAGRRAPLPVYFLPGALLVLWSCGSGRHVIVCFIFCCCSCCCIFCCWLLLADT